MGNKGASSKKSGAGGAKTQEKSELQLFQEEQDMRKSWDMATDILKSSGMNEEIAKDLGPIFSRDKNKQKGDDMTMTYKKLTPKEKTALEKSYFEALPKLGFSTGTIDIIRKKVAGSRSRLRGGGSTGATYETQIWFSYQK